MRKWLNEVGTPTIHIRTPKRAFVGQSRKLNFAHPLLTDCSPSFSPLFILKRAVVLNIRSTHHRILAVSMDQACDPVSTVLHVFN